MKHQKECFCTEQTIIDTIDSATGLTDIYKRDLADVQSEYLTAERMTVDAYIERKARLQRTPITWIETTEEHFYGMLKVLPPAAMFGGGFLVGEPMDHDAGSGLPRFSAFRKVGKRFVTGSRPMTVAEFKAEMKKPS